MLHAAIATAENKAWLQDRSALRHYLRHAHAPNTWRTYQGQWLHFSAWCQRQGLAALPAEPTIVAQYLAQRAQAGAAVASLDVTLAALRFAHTAAGIPSQLDSSLIGRVMKGIRRQHLRPQRQAEPLTGALLRQVLSEPRYSSEDLRDGALLAILYVFGLRGAEAIALDWQWAGDGRGWLSVLPDRAEVVLLGSKASPGQVERVVVPAVDNPLAIRAVSDWIGVAQIGSGAPLLRPLTRGGGIGAGRLHASSVAPIVKCAMARHFQRTGLERESAVARAAGFSGHSGRVGLCVSAVEASVPHQQLAALVRHKSLAMVCRYAEQVDRLKCSPHRFAGVGV